MWAIKALDKPPKLSMAEKQARILIDVQAFVEQTLKSRFGIPQAPHPEPPFHANLTAAWCKKTLVFTSHLYFPHNGETVLLDFIRLSYQGNDAFNLSYLRHTGEALLLFQRISLTECFEQILTHPLLYPA
jgi:hypothetical protein